MTTTSDIQFPQFAETFGDTLIELTEAAAEIARESTKVYVTGMNAMVEQQKLAYEVSQQWLSGVASARTDIGQQLVESYGSAGGELVKAAERATDVAGEAGVEVAEGSRRAVGSAARAPRKAATGTSRGPAPTRSVSSSTTGGPAKWTSEAYEALTAAEVVEQLPQFSQRELVEVETYEKAHQSRQTVLHRIASLRAPEPVAGYDELNVQEIHKRLADGDEELAKRVRDYERPHKNRDGVLSAADAQLNKA